MMNKRTVLAMLLSAVLSLGLLVSCGASGATPEAEPAGLAVSEESYGLEDLEGLISGLGDVAVIQGSQRVDLKGLLSWDNTVIEDVTLEAGPLDFNTQSAVTVTWTITADAQALAQHLGVDFNGEAAEFQSRHPEVPIYGSDNAPYDPAAAVDQEPQAEAAQEQGAEEVPEQQDPSGTDDSQAEETAGNTGNKTSGTNHGDAGTGNQTSGGAAQPTEPEHQHVWHDFIAQRWVENIVTVPDYETQKTPVGTRYIFAYDGYTTTSDEDAENHAMELILAGVDDGYRTETIYETETVQVGSHEEDQGWYEDYVVFQYCDCGAVR